VRSDFCNLLDTGDTFPLIEFPDVRGLPWVLVNVLPPAAAGLPKKHNRVRKEEYHDYCYII